MAHSQFASGKAERDGSDPFDSQLFVDDAIFIEPMLGCRATMVVECWEHVCIKMLGLGAVNTDKVRLEGQWQDAHILLGFEINVELMTIKLPTPKRHDALEKINARMLNPGNRVITVKLIQELRGQLNRWRYANRFWHYVASPINAMLAYADSTETWIRCDNDQVWLAFWNLIAHVRKLSTNPETWNALFEGKLERVISIPKRIGHPRGKSAVIWTTGDAVLDKFAAINWERSEFMLENADEFLDEIIDAHRRKLICDTEQLAATSIVVAWSCEHSLLLMGTANRNVLAWTKKGYAKKGTALKLNQMSSFWIAEKKTQVEGVYIRSGHNFSADWMTRESEKRVLAWAEKNGFTRIRFRPMWGKMKDELLNKAMEEWSMPEIRSHRQVHEPLLCVEWNGTGSAIASAAHSFGLTVKYLNSRHDSVTNQFCHRYDYGPYIGGEIFTLG